MENAVKKLINWLDTIFLSFLGSSHVRVYYGSDERQLRLKIIVSVFGLF